MKLDTYIDKQIDLKLRFDDELENGKRTPSGKLSASTLGYPLQWQILKSLAVTRGKVDDFTLRKFARGKQVEEWLLSVTPGIVEKQQFVSYQGVVGYYDATVDTDGWNFELGIIPLEVKSVTNAKFKRIMQSKSTDRGHKLQGGLYALATGKRNFAVAYVASDDFRLRVHVHSVSEIEEELHGIIEAYNAQKALGTVPVFKPVETWHKNKKYNPYPEWADLTEEEIKIKVEEYGIQR